MMNKYSWLNDFLLENKGSEKDFKEEWQWDRYLVADKMFAAICTPDEKYIKYGGREIITLKCEPMFVSILCEKYPDINEGFYMNKNNWISLYLDGEIEDSLLRELCSKSYELVFSKLTKKIQREINE